MNIKKLNTKIQNSTSQGKLNNIRVIPFDFFDLFRKQKLKVSTQNIVYFIEIDDILYLKAEGNYCKIYLQDNRQILTSKTLKYYSKQLTNKPFIRVHNSYFINIMKVAGIKKGIDSCIILSDQTEIPISRSYKESICQELIGNC